MGRKAWTWLLYGLTLTASIMFVVVGLVTFGDLAQVQYEPSAGDLGTELNGALAATFIAPVLTAALCLASFAVLVKKTWSAGGGAFVYAFCTAWMCYNAALLILAGVVLSGAAHHTSLFEQSSFWSKSATHAFTATEVLAFIAGVFQLAQGAVMVANRHQFTRLTVEELGLSERLRAPGSPGSTAVQAGAPAPSAGMPGRSSHSGAWGAESL